MRKFVTILMALLLMVCLFRAVNGREPISVSKAVARLSTMEVSMADLVQEVARERTELEQALKKEWRAALDGDGIIDTIRNVWYLLRDGFDYLWLWIQLPQRWLFFVIEAIYELTTVLWSLVFVA